MYRTCVAVAGVVLAVAAVRAGETMIESEESDQKVHDKLDAKLFEALGK